MSYIALNTAATGMSALSTSLDVTANNLANANTTGFKSSRANFEDIFYLHVLHPKAKMTPEERREVMKLLKRIYRTQQ